MKTFTSLTLSILFLFGSISAQVKTRSTINFNKDWKFRLDTMNAQDENFNDEHWRTLNLPHDWSIEGAFSEKNPATPSGGALPGGIGWYRKAFTIAEADKDKNIFIDFDGVYHNSEVWINGHYLGMRPYGYSSFRYNLTPYVRFGNQKNVIAVKVDNSKQPNSRWYSGSGIYRNVWLVTTDKIFIDHWGTFVTTSEVNTQQATVNLKIKINNTSDKQQNISVHTFIFNKEGVEMMRKLSGDISLKDSITEIAQDFRITNPTLWSVDTPYLYKAVTKVVSNKKIIDEYVTTFGIRYFKFDTDKGFSLNGKQLKINGVCNHHDLGCLGSAINTRALQRQLEILKDMGCNAIRTSHNPPAPELLELCDKMGFLVMDEAFDVWRKQKIDFDYHLDFNAWHKRDLEDMVLRDRNHPCVIIWSIGNEVLEQTDSTGDTIAKELAAIIRNLDTTRPIAEGNNDPWPNNFVLASNAVDLIGYNYDHLHYATFHERFPGDKKFLGSETVSAIATRGHYDMPSDSIRMWDTPSKLNVDFTCSAYDNCCAQWGSTHEQTLKVIKKYDFLSGQFIWTGFDYLGEPMPYPWPARSSYFGIMDLCGFPKDAFWLYQSEWTTKNVLHIFPHWNWKEGETIDVWAYYNNADQVELFLNDKSLGKRKKRGDDLHVMWKVDFKPGTLKVVSRKDRKVVMTDEIKTAGKPAKIILSADRNKINADGTDLSYITVKVTDAAGNLVLDADNLIQFTVTG
ncbi:MAG: glycoside hydrolase family 2 TIM barrel-domain containing protein, partial [Bacteroidia bacterium]